MDLAGGHSKRSSVERGAWHLGPEGQLQQPHHVPRNDPRMTRQNDLVLAVTDRLSGLAFPEHITERHWKIHWSKIRAPFLLFAMDLGGLGHAPSQDPEHSWVSDRQQCSLNMGQMLFRDSSSLREGGDAGRAERLAFAAFGVISSGIHSCSSRDPPELGR